MNVEFFQWHPKLASGRLRGSLIRRELDELGVGRGDGIVVASKHGWTAERLNGAKKVVFDVCDDHFGTHHEAHYREWCQRADAVVCSTKMLRQIIRKETGRDATVIPDTYEQPEKQPKWCNERLLWFGHKLNLPDLERAMPELRGYPITVVTDAPGYLQWSPQVMDDAFNDCGLVVIPTGVKQAKSGNRAIESIRRGKFVIAEPLPAYSELGIWIGSLRDGIEWALEHRAEVIERVKLSQDYVRAEYSPRVIAKKWLQLFESL